MMTTPLSSKKKKWLHFLQICSVWGGFLWLLEEVLLLLLKSRKLCWFWYYYSWVKEEVSFSSHEDLRFGNIISKLLLEKSWRRKKSTRADKICIDVKFSPVFSLKHTQRERTAVLFYRNSSTNDIRTQSLILIRPSRKTHNVRKSLKTSRFFETFWEK